MSTEKYNQAFTILAALNASLGFFVHLYTISIFNIVQEVLETVIFPEASMTELSLFASSPLFGAIIGALVTESIGKKFGRRWIMILNQIILIIGVFLTMFKNIPLFIIGRTLTGFEGGVAVVIVNIYITEISEDPLRGQLGTIPPIAGALAVLIANLLGMLMPYFIHHDMAEAAYRLLLGLPALIGLIKIINLAFIFKFDTPFYLVTQDNKKEAREVLKLFYNEGYTNKLDELSKEREFVYQESEKPISFTDLFTPKYRRALLASIPLTLSTYTMGGVVPYVFSNMIFSEGLETSYATLPSTLTSLVGIVNLIGNLLALVTIKYVGRRPLSIAGGSLLTLVNLAIALIIYYGSASLMSVKILVIVWVGVFSLTLNTLSYFYPTEVLPEIGVAAITALGFVAEFSFTHIFIPMQVAIGYGGAFIIFTCLAAIEVLIMAFYLVETREKSKLEIYNIYSQREEDQGLLIKQD